MYRQICFTTTSWSDTKCYIFFRYSIIESFLRCCFILLVNAVVSSLRDLASLWKRLKRVERNRRLALHATSSRSWCGALVVARCSRAPLDNKQQKRAQLGIRVECFWHHNLTIMLIRTYIYMLRSHSRAIRMLHASSRQPWQCTLGQASINRILLGLDSTASGRALR